ncbi:rhodanese-like domain-containing protein [Marivirga sp. S37H4]|uniref:Rhodanese-like domain-containing protein n=1 Tax=Marivirga aurantiaca TaxID=2802615 RepID=A0A934WW50_9BACT|nr:rhodanese-like domain-containing protein [Marivirga aurantiaca]MBK6264158.1 rhodanese-like domain-containing protein [Marivirga aurantiaca]
MKTRLIMILAFLPILACVQHSIGEITVDELRQINFSNNKDTVLLDVRTAKEYNFSSIENSLNIDLLETDSFIRSINQLDKSRHYLVICRSGSRSLAAIEKMKEMGFKNLSNVIGGMMAWEEKEFPTVKQ